MAIGPTSNVMPKIMADAASTSSSTNTVSTAESTLATESTFTVSKALKAALPRVTLPVGDRNYIFDKGSDQNEFFKVQNKEIGDVHFTHPATDPGTLPAKTREPGYETTISRAPTPAGPYEPIEGSTSTNNVPQVIREFKVDGQTVNMTIGNRFDKDT